MQGFGPMVRLFSALALCSVVTGCGAAANKNTDTLTIGAYSVIREAFHEGSFPRSRRTGRARRAASPVRGVVQRLRGPGRAIASGFDADVADALAEGTCDGWSRPGWSSGLERGPTRGIITQSLVVIGVRAGNPKRIEDWHDLGRPGRGRALSRSRRPPAGPAGTSTPSTAGAVCRQVRPVGGQADRAAVRDLMRANAGQRDQHGLLGPAEHGEFRRAANR